MVAQLLAPQQNMQLQLNPDLAIEYGQLVQAAYANPAGPNIPALYDPLGRNYVIAGTIYGNDLATDINPLRAQTIVPFGFVLQDAQNNVVIAIRGTEGIWEWLHDGAFFQVTCPFVAGAGNTEDGFTAIYQSLTMGNAAGAQRVVDALAGLPLVQPVRSLTICGHSLGAALATLLAVDLAANKAVQNLTVYTYASPRTGDPLFANTYNQLVPNTFRLANQLDLVPQLPLALPLPPLPNYQHVNTSFPLNPHGAVTMTIPCEHILTTYLYLLSQLPGRTVPAQSLSPACSPAGAPGLLNPPAGAAVQGLPSPGGP